VLSSTFSEIAFLDFERFTGSLDFLNTRNFSRSSYLLTFSFASFISCFLLIISRQEDGTW
jgi:hypothetical protein